MSRPWYCTIEDIREALDIQETARADRKVRQKIAAACGSVDKLCNRVFYPTSGTMYADWPSSMGGRRSWRVSFEDEGYDVISLSAIVSGGQSISTSDVLLLPQDGPPYTSMELDLSSGAAFSVDGTSQRSLALTGVSGYRLDEDDAGTITADVTTSSATTISVSDGSTIGVGSILRIDSERMIVTRRSWVSSGQTLQAALSASDSAVGVSVTSGAAFAVGELLLVDAERMRVVDIAGNTLVVQRAQDGSPLATHAGSTIYLSRSLTVERGALGTTAATHTSGATVELFVPPPLVTELSIAEATVGILQAGAGYARTIGSGENAREARGAGLADLRKRVRAAHGRKVRTYAV